ncbi:1-deoxy-D-xylulose-5-phosphate synthase [Buchnera aphidicola (Schlechtendalia chinensis)]|uniref:1-deoxy-D-xylulose-5-phosphate synthase n=1 Tax=Buchnera aphidicola subsp. Schlechtendalia chinensis TaxID=118110 RepID=A0A172WDW8_BUCSC|nr:1-deoxy-D-xylulose-5-phosphate synthase [Buchnera aphidicola]ANF17176.1 1-deoxy-D-xylulose-5-phosphate synthase [Buchnera aphidicola (Schlechtendalia chinensis)]
MIINRKKYPILHFARSVKKLKLLPIEKLPQLCYELRQYLIDIVSKSGGHLSSSLGVIEITVALHYVFDTPFDNLIWDVGHQTYPHKILTGRSDIQDINKKSKLHPFPYRKESKYDAFGGGHAATSISAGVGMAIASNKENKNRRTVCVIGDGAITSGMAFEAMNHAGHHNIHLLIILNHNSMSISKNVGALNLCFSKISIDHNLIKKYKERKNFCIKSDFLNKDVVYQKEYLRDMKFYNTFFNDFGFQYFGPLDGHDIFLLIDFISRLSSQKYTSVLHIITKKGKGYFPAELNPTEWHSVPKFDINTGKICSTRKDILTYSEVFGNWLCTIAKKDKKLIGITPAMTEGSGMVNFSKFFPEQYFDVAIAEQHAVTFSAGLAISGYKPVLAIYSTFLQRAYDQVIHDIALQKLPVLFAIDRGGIVGQDGETHQGVFDLTYLRCIPNIVIMTPSDENECFQMLYTGYCYRNGPSVVRYPRGMGIGTSLKSMNIIPIGKGIIKRFGKKIAILNFGPLCIFAEKVAKKLDFTLVDMRFVKPLDINLILCLTKNHHFFVTLEEGMVSGGAGSSVNEFFMKNKITIPILNIGIPDIFVPHGDQSEIRRKYELDSDGILKKILSWLNK